MPGEEDEFLNYQEALAKSQKRPTRTSLRTPVAEKHGKTPIKGATVAEAVSDYINWHRNKGSAPGTIREAVYPLDDRIPVKAKWLPLLAWCKEREIKYLSELDKNLCQEWLDQMRDNGSPSSGRRGVIILKRLLTFCKDFDLLDVLPIKLVEPTRPDTEINVFTDDEIDRIAKFVQRENVRDWAIFMLLVDTGIRAEELCSLKMEDLRLDRRELVVHGKGRGGQGKVRIVPLQGSLGPLKAWLRERGEIDGVEWLFLAFNLGRSPVYAGGNGKTPRRQSKTPLRNLISEAALTTTGLRTLCTKWGKLANVTEARNSPHTYRHYFAVTYLRRDGDVFTLQKILGHTKLEMTMKYARMAQIDLRRVHSQASPAMRFLPKRAIAANKEKAPDD